MPPLLFTVLSSKYLHLMELYVGTSGWAYSWNIGGSLEWYCKNTGLNAVELNASFYRFPFPSQVKSWASKGKEIKWVIKVSRRITHLHKFNEEAREVWKSFSELFNPLDPYVEFYLFQLPPSYTPKELNKIVEFHQFTGLGKRFALEPRNIQWFDQNIIQEIKNQGITWVSINAPKLPDDIINTSGIVYLRMHGKTTWYSYEYNIQELMDIAQKIVNAKPEKIFVFFNNDFAMLKNAQEMMKILSNLLEE